MIKELVVIEKLPKIPNHWDYAESVKKVKQTVYKWKNLTTEIVTELYVARELLSRPGTRTDLKQMETWEDYCNEIGIEKRTANRWIERTLEPTTSGQMSQGSNYALPDGQFQVIYADPPWQFDNSGFDQSAANTYLKTMPTEDIMAMPIKQKVKENAVLFLWATNAMLQDALLVMDAWGFFYKTNLVWCKDRSPGMGWFTNSKHELLLLGVTGMGLHPQTKPDSWFQAKVTKHSKKPDQIYELIEKMYPAPYIELFARNNRNNWSSWGNEL